MSYVMQNDMEERLPEDVENLDKAFQLLRQSSQARIDNMADYQPGHITELMRLLPETQELVVAWKRLLR